MPPIPDRLLPGRAVPLGASWDGLGVNFAVFSANAERIELCLFDPSGRREVKRLPLPECTDEVWHGYLPDARPGQLYGYRAYGPYEPRRVRLLRRSLRTRGSSRAHRLRQSRISRGSCRS